MTFPTLHSTHVELGWLSPCYSQVAGSVQTKYIAGYCKVRMTSISTIQTHVAPVMIPVMRLWIQVRTAYCGAAQTPTTVHSHQQHVKTLFAAMPCLRR